MQYYVLALLFHCYNNVPCNSNNSNNNFTIKKETVVRRDGWYDQK